MLQGWIQRTAENGAFKNVLLNSEASVSIAFHLVCTKDQGLAYICKDCPQVSVVDIDSFKDFLVHLFVISILWTHFKHADEWMEGVDLGSERLSFQKFKMAYRTFSAAYANESLSDEVLQKDFDLIDTNKSGTIEFTEVCKYCVDFFKGNFPDHFAKQSGAAYASSYSSGFDLLNELELVKSPRESPLPTELICSSTSTVSVATLGQLDRADEEERSWTPISDVAEVPATASAKARRALDAIGERVVENAKIATFEEMKLSTEVLLGIST